MTMVKDRMRRRFELFAAAGVVALTLIAIAGTALALIQSARDEFSVIAYGGNNGTVDWTSSWNEVGELDGPTAGAVDVVKNTRCVADNCLRIGGNPADVDGRGVWREANLASALSAALTFSYRRESAVGTGSVALAISNDGGATWVTLAVYDFAGSANRINESFDITSFASSNTRIRFLASGSGVTNYLYFDNVDITADLPTSTTTTATVTIDTTTTTATVAPTPTSTTSTTAPTIASDTTTAATTTTTTAAVATTTPTTTVAPTTSSTTSTTAAAVIEAPPPGTGEVHPAARSLSPIEGLTVAFSTAAEALGDSALPAIVLGTLVAWLAILGLEQRDSRRSVIRKP